MKRNWPGILLLALALTPVTNQAQDIEQIPTASHQYVQAWLGRTDKDGTWIVSDPETTATLRGNLSRLPYGGGAAQRLWGSWLQYGLEGGGLLAWKDGNVTLIDNNGGFRGQANNNFILLEVFMGGVAGIRPAHWLRLYAAAGPSIAWGYLDIEENTSAPIPPGNRNDVSVAFYGRGGIDVILPNRFTVGFGARHANHKFDFGQRGKQEFDDMQWFLILGQRF